MDKTYRIFRNIFGLIGLAMVGGGLYWASHVRSFASTALKAPGRVTEMRYSDSGSGSSMAPTVVFTTPEGREISLRSSMYSSPPEFSVGERVEVLYEGADPENAEISSFMQLWFGPLIVGGIGLPFLCIGLGFGIAMYRGKALRRDMQDNGRRILAELIGVEKNTSLKVNGRSPWRIEAQWLNPATQKVQVLRSENLWFDPSPYLQGKQVTVLIDPDNPKRYWMDVSFLPELESS